MIDVHELEKTYAGGIRAVDGITFSVDDGEIFAFLGPNGAGKTTTIKVLITLIEPTGGSASVAGLDVVAQAAAVRERIGYAAQEVGLDRYATGRENMMLQGRLYHVPTAQLRRRVDEVLDFFDMTEAADRMVESYSGGMRKRLDLGAALMHEPELLFLDEPTVGLDPESRAHVWTYIEKLRQDGVTVFMTTHYLEEADHLADRVAIIDEGRIVAAGSPDALKDEIEGDRITLEFAAAESLDRAAGLLEAMVDDGDERVVDVTRGEQVVHARVRRGAEALPAVLSRLEAAGTPAKAAEVARPSLDDVFLRHTGRSLRQRQAPAGAPGETAETGPMGGAAS